MVTISEAIAHHYPDRVVPYLDQAKDFIDILMYEWKWYSHEKAGGVSNVNYALIAASRRGVKIRCLLNAESMGHAITRINARTINFLRPYGIECKFGQVGVVTHGKMVLIDKRVLVVGSHNFTKCAFTRNQEVSIIVDGVDEVKPYQAYFDTLWSQF